jgi:hypothetical protein
MDPRDSTLMNKTLQSVGLCIILINDANTHEGGRMKIRCSTNEQRRGCGFRKEGGLYLVGDGPSKPCGKLPKEMGICPVCGHGLKPGRGPQWTDPSKIWAAGPCDGNAPDRIPGTRSACLSCPLCDPPTFAGILWIGEDYTPTTWAEEAIAQGVSRRIPNVPKDSRFKVGSTWIFVGFRKGFDRPCGGCAGTGNLDCSDYGTAPRDELIKACPLCSGSGKIWTPGIFQAFRPKALEYILTDNDKRAIARKGKGGLSPNQKKIMARLERMEKAGVTLVELKRTDGLGDVHKGRK